MRLPSPTSAHCGLETALEKRDRRSSAEAGNAALGFQRRLAGVTRFANLKWNKAKFGPQPGQPLLRESYSRIDRPSQPCSWPFIGARGKLASMKQNPKTIGVISDTHGLLRPQALRALERRAVRTLHGSGNRRSMR